MGKKQRGNTLNRATFGQKEGETKHTQKIITDVCVCLEVGLFVPCKIAHKSLNGFKMKLKVIVECTYTTDKHLESTQSKMATTASQKGL